MIKIIKNKGKTVKAYKLGAKSKTVEKLISEGKVKKLPDGTYEVLSQEAVKGGRNGQIARRGDYIKIDNTGSPYPNDAEFFKANHRHLSGCVYEQLPKPLDAWTSDMPMCPEVQYLIDRKGLVLNESDPQHYFNAELWGSMLSAPEDAVLVFYSVDRDNEGNITGADFNFVVRDHFEDNYSVVTDGGQ